MSFPAFTDAELERYARQIIVPAIGGAGQAKLATSRATIVGAGGIGAPVLLYLSAAGVGHLTIIDDDVVSLSNLHRQVLYTTDDVGADKVATAAAVLRRINPHVTVVEQHARLTPENARALLSDSDLIIDGSDRFATRLAVNAAAYALRTPLLSAAIGPFDGQVALFANDGGDGPCYACLTGPIDDADIGNCGELGLPGPIAGIVGTTAALEAVRALVPFGTALTGHLWIVDMLARRTRTVAISKDPACPVCHASN